MLTHIEIDGFKSFEGFSLDVPPFCVIVGPNATGKSNLFDALRLLSRLAETDVRSAVQELRGEPFELFRTQPDGNAARRISIAVEALLDKEVGDAYGKTHSLKGMRVRYEVGIELRGSDHQGLERLYVFKEEARLLARSADRLFQESPSKRKQALNKWAPATHKKLDLIATHQVGSTTTLEVSQDGSQGRPRKVPFGEASATFISTVRTADEFPHLFALREELAAFRFLQLNPAVERLPSDMLAKEELQADGSNLATVLARIKSETRTEARPLGALADIRSDLASLIPGILDLEVERNDVARQFQVYLTMRDQARFSSRVLSDGTLRVLALLTLLHDPRRRGVLCFEEPENGVHEARIGGLIEVLRGFCTDLSETPEAGEKLSQIIVNTHSPIVMRHLNDDEIVAADTMLAIDPATQMRYRRTRMRTGVTSELPLTSETEREHKLTRAELEQLIRGREPDLVN